MKKNFDPFPPSVQGQPGYRTRNNLSGLDPVDTAAESAHMQGVFLRLLFTLRLRTRNPVYLTAMFVIGVGMLVLSVPFITVIFSPPATESLGRFIRAAVIILIILGIPLSVGIFLLLNFALSLTAIKKANLDVSEQDEEV